MSRLGAAAGTLARREIVRFLRQRNRVTGALLQPIVFWLLLGFGFRRSFALPGAAGEASYLAYAFPGIVVLSLLFTAIFATISVIEDRREGFLQDVLVAPVPRLAIVLGKVAGGSVLAAGQGALYLLLAPLLGLELGAARALLAVALLLATAAGLVALGFLIAWRMSSTQGFHAIMNVFLMPLWLLSGAFFPAEGAAAPLALVMRLNPLTYAVAALRDVLDGRPLGADFARSVLVVLASGAVLAAWAARAASRRRLPGLAS